MTPQSTLRRTSEDWINVEETSPTSRTVLDMLIAERKTSEFNDARDYYEELDKNAEIARDEYNLGILYDNWKDKQANVYSEEENEYEWTHEYKNLIDIGIIPDFSRNYSYRLFSSSEYNNKLCRLYDNKDNVNEWYEYLETESIKAYEEYQEYQENNIYAQAVEVIDHIMKEINISNIYGSSDSDNDGSEEMDKAYRLYKGL